MDLFLDALLVVVIALGAVAGVGFLAFVAGFLYLEWCINTGNEAKAMRYIDSLARITVWIESSPARTLEVLENFFFQRAIELRMLRIKLFLPGATDLLRQLDEMRRKL